MGLFVSKRCSDPINFNYILNLPGIWLAMNREVYVYSCEGPVQGLLVFGST